MAKSLRGWYWHLCSASLLAMGYAITWSGDCAKAQITFDGTLPNNSIITSQGNTSIITGGTVAGSNLFHSFEQFSVPTGSAAYFNNTLDIQNIISRVTGESISNIDGLLRTNGTANLFLLNPNGIIFGPSARLNIGGSFIGSTANSLQLSDGSFFSTINPQAPPLLNINVPIGLQFGKNQGRILVQGNGQGVRLTTDLIDTTVGLRVQPNQTLALVGGDVALEGGTLKTAGGRIELGSVANPSLVSLTQIDSGWTFGYEGVQNFRDIQLSQSAAVDASGVGGGDVQVRGRRVTLKDGSQIEASTLKSEPGGTLTVRASELVELIGQSPATQIPTSFVAGVYPGATGNGGNVSLKTGRLIVREGAVVLASTFGQGQGGNLNVTASESVELMGASALLTQSDYVEAAEVEAADDAGAAGELTITTRRLIVKDGAVVSASTFTEGQGGNLTVIAEDSVELMGTSPDRQFPSGLYTQTQGAGAAGNLTVNTERLTVRDEARVAVNSRGSGNAGDLKVAAREIRLNNQGIITAETALGNGGNITLQAQNLLLMRKGSNISTTAGTAGTGGDGGNIDIDTNFLVAVPEENSDITGNAYTGKGGRVEITTQSIFGTQFREKLTPESDITASSDFGVQGVVEINTPDIDPSRGLVNLPAELVDASNQIATGCRGGVRQGESKFVITGRGGLPSNPSEALSSDAIQVDWVTLNPGVENSSSPPVSTNPTAPTPTQIVEAQGWVINNYGEVVLTATAPTVTANIPWMTPVSCHTPGTSS